MTIRELLDALKECNAAMDVEVVTLEPDPNGGPRWECNHEVKRVNFLETHVVIDCEGE